MNECRTEDWAHIATLQQLCTKLSIEWYNYSSASKYWKKYVYTQDRRLKNCEKGREMRTSEWWQQRNRHNRRPTTTNRCDEWTSDNEWMSKQFTLIVHFLHVHVYSYHYYILGCSVWFGIIFMIKHMNSRMCLHENCRQRTRAKIKRNDWQNDKER